MPLSLEMIVLILIALIMLISILVGIIQGFRKNCYWLVATILFWVVFFVTAPLLSKSNVWYDPSIYQKLGMDSSYSCLMDYLKAMIANAMNLDVSLIDDPAVENTLIAIALSAIRIVYLLLLSIVYFVLMKIIYAIFFASSCKVSKSQIRKLKRKQEKEIRKKGAATEKTNKKLAAAEKRYDRKRRSHLLGMVSGFCRGAISCFLILSLINSLVALLPDIKEDSISASDGTEAKNTLTIYDYIVQNYPEYQSTIDYILDYQQSNLATITSLKVNGQPLDTLLIDAILTGKKENCTFSIRKELQQIIKIGAYAFTLTNGFDMDNFDYYSLDEKQIELVQNILVILSDDDLIKNLGSVIVALSLTISGIKDEIPATLLDISLYQDIDLSAELLTIADLVAYVYGMGDLSALDYAQIPEDNFVGILQTLSSLQSIQLIGTIGSYFGMKNLSLPESDLNQLENKLAAICWSDDIASISTLYEEYKNLFTYYNENQSDEMLSLVYHAPTDDLQSVMDTIFETTFLEAILPDVLTIVKSKIAPEYASLINPNVTLSSQWKTELDTVFSMLRQLQDSDVPDPFVSIEQFDLSVLQNLSTATVMSSELLTYAVIKTLIDGSDGNGIVPALQNYVIVPDSLKTYDQNTHEFAAQWYGTEGELYVVFETLKNAASKVENIKYPAGSFVPLLQSIDANYLMKSDVLYCSINQILKTYNDYLIIPEDSIQSSELTLNQKPLEMVTRNEIINILAIVCGENNLLDLEKLYVYYQVDENGTETKLEGKPDHDDYVVKLDINDINKFMALLTSERIYDAGKQIDNTTKLFQSAIIRATLSNYLEEYGAQIIATPSALSDLSVSRISIYNPSSNVHLDENQKLAVLSTIECANLIKAFISLDLDINSLKEDPFSLIETFKEVNQDGSIIYKQEKVNNIFARSQQQTYSELLHATLSKYINDFATDSQGSSFALVVPADVIEESTDYITSEEIVNLVKALVFVDIQAFSGNSSADLIAEEILHNEYIQEAFDSIIFRATISQYVSDNDALVIPDDDQQMMSGHRVMTKASLSGLINSIRALQIRDFNGLLSDPMSLLDCFVDEQDGSFDYTLADSIFLTDGEHYSSILHATLSSKLQSFALSDDFTMIIPSTVYEEKTYDGLNGYINSEELIEVLKAVCSVKEEFDAIQNQTMTTEQVVDSLIKTEKINDTFDSVIFRATITNYLQEMGDQLIVLPSSTYEVLGENDVLLKKDLVNLVHAFNLMDLDISTISNDPLSLADVFKQEDGTFDQNLAEQIFDRNAATYSYILHATLSSYIDTYAAESAAQDFTIIVPPIHDEDSYLPSEEIIHLLQSFVYIDIDHLIHMDSDLAAEVQQYMNDPHFDDVLDSIILRATLTDYILSFNVDDTIIIPDESQVCDHYGDVLVITKEEMLRVKNAVNCFDGLDEALDLNSILIADVSLHKEVVFASYIFKASFSHYILSYTTVSEEENVVKIIVPDDVYTAPYIIDEELFAFVDSLAILHPGSFVSFNQFSNKDLAAINRNQVEKFFQSEIIVATTSPRVYDELISINLSVPEPLTRDNMTKEELIAIYVAMDVLLAENESIVHADLSYETILNSDLFDQSEEDKILLLCQSKVIAYNLVLHIQEENESTMNNALYLDLHRDGTPVDWYYQSDEEKGELYDLLYALHILKSQGYYTALTSLDPSKTQLSIFKEELFIKTVTENHILCDAIPTMLDNFKCYFEDGNPFLSLDQMYVNENGDQIYWGGQNSYQDGELYRFFDSIDAANRVKSYSSVDDIDQMQEDINLILNSEVSAPIIIDYLTDETLVEMMNKEETRVLLGEPALSCPQLIIPPETTSWQSITSQEYIYNFATIYLTAKQKGISL